jgi:hypothetical protein
MVLGGGFRLLWHGLTVSGNFIWWKKSDSDIQRANLCHGLLELFSITPTLAFLIKMFSQSPKCSKSNLTDHLFDRYQLAELL